MGKRRTGPGARDGGQQGGAGGRQGVGRGDKLGTAQICQCLRGERQGPEPCPGPQARRGDQGAGTRASVPSPRLTSPRAFPASSSPASPTKQEARGERSETL